MKKHFIIPILALVSLIVLILFYLFSFSDKKLRVIVCDVGQGDSILIITPTQAQILIDGGPDKAVLGCLSKYMPFWDRSIDVLILTHPHADHMIGLIDVLERYNVNSFYTLNVKSDSDAYKLLEAKLANENLSAKHLNNEDSFRDRSGAKIKVLWPRLDPSLQLDHNIANPDLNELSVVALLTFGNFSMLFTGDAEEEVLNLITDEAGDIDILKVPHHGSRDGVNEMILKILKPEVSLISVGAKNRFGHPSRETLDLLHKFKSSTFRTDTSGEIIITADGTSYLIHLEGDL